MVLSLGDLGVTLPAGADREWAVRHVSFSLLAGQTVCLVGESGSGKTVVAEAVMGMLPAALPLREGCIELLGAAVPPQRSAEFNALRGPRLSMIFQDAAASLNPIQRVGQQLEEILQVHGIVRSERRTRVMQLLQAVQLAEPERVFRSYPHQLSGGQAQRIVIAGALLLNPQLLIADEPTTALDVTTQAEILQLIDNLKQRFGTAVLFITHDLGVVADIADHIVVMQEGSVVDSGPAAELLANPAHAYTRKLIAAASLERRSSTKQETPPVLEAHKLSLTYRSGVLFNRREVAAVRRVSLSLHEGQTLAVVGESGSGKSSLAKCLLRLEDSDQGSIFFRGTDMTHLRGAALQAVRARMQVVLQDPFSALNPRMRILDAVAEGPIIHGLNRSAARASAAEMLERVGLTPQAAERYPQEFSGGQRQRICIARALVMKPEILIADEAVSALDVSIQLQILDLFAELQQQLGFAMIFITHDLRVAAAISDQVLVMRHGKVVERGDTEKIFTRPEAAYTRALLACAPGVHGQLPA